jgi:hypothetical protein
LFLCHKDLVRLQAALAQTAYGAPMPHYGSHYKGMVLREGGPLSKPCCCNTGAAGQDVAKKTAEFKPPIMMPAGCLVPVPKKANRVKAEPAHAAKKVTPPSRMGRKLAL